jgi:hypothetical protein
VRVHRWPDRGAHRCWATVPWGRECASAGRTQVAAMNSEKPCRRARRCGSDSGGFAAVVPDQSAAWEQVRTRPGLKPPSGTRSRQPLSLKRLTAFCQERIVTKSVRLGELSDPVSRKRYTRVNAEPRERDLPRFSYFLRPVWDLRRAGGGGRTLWFEGEHSGCERDAWGYARTPNVSRKYSRTLGERGPDELTRPYRSHPERESEGTPLTIRGTREAVPPPCRINVCCQRHAP